ncbi:MAG: hypothetical protein KF691_07020 [Phycisphaeraceae bacterium]|nr:hypothetical protein [Phycisphaeraceae bacterium]
MMGAGWMQAKLRCGRRSLTLYPGYSTDVLGGLLEATLELIESNGVMDVVPEKGPEFEAPIQVSCYWDCEPGNYRWDLTFVSAEQLSISFSEILPGKRKLRHKLLFETEVSARTWCEMLLSNAARILRRHGLAGYRGAWNNYEFPVGLYLRLLSYRKSQFRFGSVPDDFDSDEQTSLSRELRLLLREVGL